MYPFSEKFVIILLLDCAVRAPRAAEYKIDDKQCRIIAS